MRYTDLILILSFMLCMSCQSTRLPNDKIIYDPSPQLAYRYVHPQKAFSFDFPYYGTRFFKEMDEKAVILTRNLN